MPKGNTTSIFLNDEPCYEESAFAIHGAVAEAIVDEIEHNPAGNIAILGEWGSGKSTVLKHIESKLSEDFIFFTFDAWAHSGDSLRRNFIESLVLAIAHSEKGNDDCGCDLLSQRGVRATRRDSSKSAGMQKKAYDLIGSMSGSVTTSTTDEESALKPIPAALLIGTGTFAFLSILFSALVPVIKNLAIAASWIAAGTNYGISQYIPIISLILACFAGFYAKRKIAKRRNASKPKQPAFGEIEEEEKKQKSSIIDDMANFFAKRTTGMTSITKTEYSSILDSCEFEKLFFSALNLTDKTVVIAFDNLDRLDSNEIASVWSTLQIFSTPSSTCKCNHRAWLVLPITRNAFIELEGAASDDPSSEEHDKLTSLSKLFIRNFEIPTPISTDWKQYFYSQARKAFPEIGDKTLVYIYTIASHSLLNMKLRTPRNAKRFLNSMVAQARVFRNIDLKSIAAYCYLRDAYNMNRYTQSFNEFMIDVINGKAKESFYLSSLEHQRINLKSDLAMMTFGQFSPEKASEVFVYAEFNKAIANNTSIDICKLVSENPGSWETLNRLAEDELINCPGDATPPWVFSLLHSLDPSNYNFNPENKTELHTFARRLLSSVKNVGHESVNRTGKIIAHYIPYCSYNTIETIVKAIIKELASLISAAEADEAEIDYEHELELYIAEVIPVFQATYESSKVSKMELGKAFQNVEFGSSYSKLLNCTAKNIDKCPTGTWLAVRPPATTEELCSVIEYIHPFVTTESLEEISISIVRESELLASCSLNTEEVDFAKDRLGIDEQNTEEWESSLWILVNVCKIQSPCINDLFSSIEFDIDRYRYYANDSGAAHKLALSWMALQYNDRLDDPGQPNATITRIFDKDCIQLAKDKDIDFFPVLIKHLGDTLSDRTIRWMLERIWCKEDAESREMVDCLKYARATYSAQKRKELGHQLALAKRIDELMSTSFDIHMSSVYLGAIEADNNTDKFQSWLIDNFKNLSAENWKVALTSRECNDIWPLLEAVCNARLPLPSLDDAVANLVEKNLYYRNINLAIKSYQLNVSSYNNALTNRFFKDASSCKDIIEHYGAEMHKYRWLAQLTSNDRYVAIETIINSKTGYCMEWLAYDLCIEENPKRLLRGHIKKLKALLRKKMQLKSPAENYKKAASEVLSILS